MKFHLSHLLLLIVIVAVSLGWYVDHRHRNRLEIVGNWVFDPPLTFWEYTSTMTIRDDGTFTKVDQHSILTDTFEGTYQLHKNGVVDFHLKSRATVKDSDAPNSTRPTSTPMNKQYQFRCAVDRSGRLLMVDQNYIASLSPPTNEDLPLTFAGSYKPAK